MEFIVAKEYFHPASIGKLDKCDDAYCDADEFLSTMYDKQGIDGYNIILLANAEQCIEELVGDAWKSMVPREHYPVLYVFVQPNSNGIDFFDAFLKSKGFVFVK